MTPHIRLTARCMTLAVALGVGALAPVATASADPDRGPHKSTPHSSTHSSTSGGSGSQHVRRGAEPDRDPHKSVPGNVSTSPRAQTNRGRADFRGSHSDDTTRSGSGTASSTATGATPDRSTTSRSAQPGPGTTTSQSPQPGPAATQPSAGPTAEARRPQSDPEAVLGQRQPMSVRIGSTAEGADVPGSSIISCDNGCASASDRSYGTVRVVTPDQIGPGRDPRTAAVDISAESTTARGGFSGNLIDKNPNLFSGGNAGIAMPDRGTANTGVGAGGQGVKPGKGATLDVAGNSQVELRVARAVPDGTYPVTTQMGPGTAIHYRYEYEKRSITGVTVNGIGPNVRSDWSPASRSDVDDYVRRGVPLPALAKPATITPTR